MTDFYFHCICSETPVIAETVLITDDYNMSHYKGKQSVLMCVCSKCEKETEVRIQ